MARASRRAGGAVTRESCLGDFWLSRARPRTHSQQETWLFGRPPLPMGSLSVRVLRDGSSVPPLVSTLSLSFDRPCLGSHVHSLSGPSQQSPASWLRLAHPPLGHPPVFPHPDERHVYFVDSFIRCSRQDNAHTKSHTLTLPLSGHIPRWLAE